MMAIPRGFFWDVAVGRDHLTLQISRSSWQAFAEGWSVLFDGPDPDPLPAEWLISPHRSDTAPGSLVDEISARIAASLIDPSRLPEALPPADQMEVLSVLAADAYGTDRMSMSFRAITSQELVPVVLAMKSHHRFYLRRAIEQEIKARGFVLDEVLFTASGVEVLASGGMLTVSARDALIQEIRDILVDHHVAPAGITIAATPSI